MQKKKSIKEYIKTMPRKIVILITLLVISLAGGGMMLRAFAEDLPQEIQWSGSFTETTTEWSYSTEGRRFITVTCPCGAHSGNFEEGSDYFTIDTSGNTATFTVNEEAIARFLQDKECEQVKLGEIVKWSSNSGIRFRNGTFNKQVVFDTLEEALGSDGGNETNLSLRRIAAVALYESKGMNVNLDQWSDRGCPALCFVVVDTPTKTAHFISHHFYDSFWDSLQHDDEFRLTPDNMPNTAKITIECVSTDEELLKSKEESATMGESYTYTYTADSTIIQNGITYKLKEWSWEDAKKEENGSGTSAKITINPVESDSYTITITYEEEEEEPDEPDATPTPTPSPAPHECTPGPWKYDDMEHWKVCTECSKKIPDTQGYHELEAGEPDSGGNSTKTCTVCGYSYTSHSHKWVQWAPWSTSVEYVMEYREAIAAGKTYKDFEYKNDPEKYHWKYCEYYPGCTSTLGRTTHKWDTEYRRDGGWWVIRCTECGWPKDWYPALINVTLDPRGGTFPLTGNTNPILFKDIEYYSITDLHTLGPEYYPEKEDMSFAGFAYFFEGEGFMYLPDEESKTMKGNSKYFKKLPDGSYRFLIWTDCTLLAQWRKPQYEVHYLGNSPLAQGNTITSYHEVGVEKELSPNGYYCVSHLAYNVGDVAGSVETTLANTEVTAEFKGWAMSSNGEIKYQDKETVLDVIKTSGKVNLYAVWDYGTIILPNATAADGGSKLSGWKTTDGTFISVLDNTGNYSPVEYQLKGKNETFTAVWVPNAYTVTFDSAGGTPCDPISVIYKKPFGTLPTTTKKGYTFLCWKWKVEDKVITSESIVEYATNYVLTAEWKVNDVTVLLDYNFDFEIEAVNPAKNSNLTSVNFNTDKMIFPYDSLYGVLPQPTMDGYTFAGWYFEEDADGNGCGEQDCLLNSAGTRVEKTETHTIHARWVKNQYRIDLDYNYDYSIWED